MKAAEIRFFDKVTLQFPDVCWGWCAAKDHFGYGFFWNGKRMMHAHRFSWILHFGSIPEGLCVLHNCDNPPCTNPNHLFLGTRSDNVEDCIKKGRRRQLKGEDHPNRKLNRKAVVEIRKLIALGKSHREIGKQFGVSNNPIWMISKNRTWKSVP